MSLWDVMVSIFWFFILFAWIWLLIVILTDIFRDHTLSGWAKAGWTLFLVVVPWLGALVYLIVRGHSMNERARAQAAQNQKELQDYIQQTAAQGSSQSTADELAKLADLRDRGALNEHDYEQAKAKVLGGGEAPAVAAQRSNAQPSATTTTPTR
jgi:hypothetical protein